MPPLSRDFRETVVNRARRDPEFRAALVQEALDAFLEGDDEGCRSLLRDVINATAGFPAIAGETGIAEKSLMRMVGPRGNPTASNLARIVAAVQKKAGVKGHVEMELCPT